jgi:hypothetical protein
MSKSGSVRTFEDLERAVRAVATEFKTDKIFIIGSQGILLAWPDAPPPMRSSPEIDVYPENARDWERREKERMASTLTASTKALRSYQPVGRPEPSADELMLADEL